MKIVKKMAVGASLLLAAALANATDYPTKPIRLIVPLAPGGGGDMAARLVASEMAKTLGQSIIIENKPGASSIIGTSMAAKSTGDGYNLLFVSDFHAINEAMSRLGKLPNKLPYDSIKDFEPVGQVLNLPIALLASNKSGIKSVRELTEKARSMNGAMSAGLLGEGSPHYLAFLNMQRIGNYKLIEVPYGGSGPATIAVQAGEVDLAFSTVGAALQMANADRARLLAVSGTTRDPLVPHVPTIAESGYAGFSIMSWMGILAPKAVPSDRLQILNAALNKALANPAVVSTLKANGMYPAPGTREEFAKLLVDEASKIEQIYRNSEK